MIDWTDLWTSIFDLWEWAWNWNIPLAGHEIKVIPLCLGVFVVEFILDICFPSPPDWNGGDNGGDN